MIEVSNGPVLHYGSGAEPAVQDEQPFEFEDQYIPVEELPQVARDDARRGVAGALANLDVNIRFMRAPGITPQPIANTSSGTGFNAYYANVTLGNDSTNDPSFSVDRQTLLLNQAFSVHGHTVAAYAGEMMNARILGVSVSGTNHTTNASNGGWLFFDKNYVGPGFIHHFMVNGNPISVGAATYVAGGNGIKVLERWDDWIKVEQTRQRSKGLVMTGGFSNGAIGGFGRLAMSRDKELILRRWLKPGRAADVLRGEARGLKTYLRNKAVALGLTKPVLTFPKINDPLGMELGDQVICSVTGSITGGIAFATGVLVTGLSYTRTGTFECVVHRRKNAETEHKDTIALVLSPKKVTHGFSGATDFPLVGDLHMAATKSRAMRQSFLFYTDVPESMAAYYDIMHHGKWPGAALHLDTGTAPLPLNLTRWMSKETLPKGTVRLFAERAQMTFASALGGCVTLPRHLPFLSLHGFGWERRAESMEHLIGDGKAVMATSSHRITVDKEWIFSKDTRQVGVDIPRIALSEPEVTFPRNVTLSFSLSATKASAKARNAMIHRLNDEVLVDPLYRFFENGPATKRKYSYSINVSRSLKLKELSILLKLGRVDDVQEHFPRMSSEFAALIYDLGDVGKEALAKPELTKPAWKAFLRRAGIKGVGELHRFFGVDDAIEVSSTSSAPDLVKKEVLRLEGTYPWSMHPVLEERKELETRIKEISDAMDISTDALREAEADPIKQRFEPKQREQHLVDLNSHKRKLCALLETRHMNGALRETLHRKVSRKQSSRLLGIEKYVRLSESFQGVPGIAGHPLTLAPSSGITIGSGALFMREPYPSHKSTAGVCPWTSVA